MGEAFFFLPFGLGSLGAFGKRFEVHPSLARWKEGNWCQRFLEVLWTFHSVQTEILEGIVEEFEESFDGASPESGSETAVIMAVPQVAVTVIRPFAARAR